jgi:hydrogenase expression/formation protein HypD
MKNEKEWLKEIHNLNIASKIRIMNVCGGHERTITHAGLRNALPENVEIIPGPGCPVCVCPEEDVYAAIELSQRPNVILVAFGDMLRVPTNAPKSYPRSLEAAKALGADIRPIAAPQEAVKIAIENQNKEVIFFAAGFETTTAPVAAMLAQGIPENLSILLSARLTWPAVAMLLESETPNFEGLIAPGHVCAIMGAEEWQFVIDGHNIPSSVAGFSPQSLLAAIYSVLRQKISGELFLDNCYPNVVVKNGNPTAQKVISEVLDIVDSNWRGIGIIPNSGYKLKENYSKHDARLRFELNQETRKHAGEMPIGCDCAKVILGKIYPNQCRLYGKACVPKKPIGPCMVSDEGACRIWWSGGMRDCDIELNKSEKID